MKKLSPIQEVDRATTDFREPEIATFKTPKGLSRAVVETISRRKSEPAWMLEKRLHAYNLFCAKPMPSWGADLSDIDFNAIHYYVQPQDQQGRKWSEVPKEIKETFDKLIGFKARGTENEIGLDLANALLEAGLKVPNEVFVEMFERVSK